MKYTQITLATILCFGLFLFSCENQDQITGDESAVKPVEEVNESSVFTSDEYNVENDELIEEQKLPPRIAVEGNTILLDTINVNLDIDSELEQILIVKKNNSADNYIYIIVADYDDVRDKYIKSWEGKTSGTSIRTFVAYNDDIVGDYNQEIVCKGMNDNEEQTLDIFRRTHPPTGLGLYYAPIVTMTSGGTIEIIRAQRSAAYERKQKIGISYAIELLEQDTNSTSDLDLVKKTFNWKYEELTYVQTSEEKVSGKTISNEMIRSVWYGGVSDFKKFMSGLWYRKGSHLSRDAMPDLIQFEPAKDLITYYSNDVQELYTWHRSYKSLYNVLLSIATNKRLSHETKQYKFTIIGLNEISISENFYVVEDILDGTYIRLTESLQESLKISPLNYTIMLPNNHSGLFKSNTGIELLIDSPKFTMTENEVEVSGAISFITLNEDIMQLKILDKNGLTEEVRNYKITFNEVKDEKKILRTMELYPGKLGIKGIQVDEERPIRLEQVEFIQ